MPYVLCPKCKDPERTIHMEILTAYEWDTNAGGHPEIVEAECGCDLSAEEEDAAYAEAYKLDPTNWDPAHDW